MSEEPSPSNEPGERYVEHLPGFMLPPEHEVDCGCDPRLQRPVLRDPTGWNQRITACMRCGKVTLTESIVEEPRPHDVRRIGCVIQPISPDALEWLSAWPRLAWGVFQEDPAIYLPASLRCQTTAELEVQERDFLARQRNLSDAQRLRSVGIPDQEPPIGMPDKEYLNTFVQTKAGLLLGPDTDLETLLAHSGSTDWASPFAYKILKSRPDFTQVVLDLLASQNEGRRRLGILLVQRGPNKDPQIVTAVIGLLERASLDPSEQRWLHTLLDTLYKLGSAAAAARPILLEMANKIKPKDYYMGLRLEEIRDLIK